MPNFFIGIDSGGTKCEVIFSDANFNIIRKFSEKTHQYFILGNVKTVDFLSKMIKKSTKDLKFSLKNCLGIGIGLAGVRQESDRESIRKNLSGKLKFRNLIVTTDSMATLFGAFEDKNGAILICGTGSIIYGKHNNKLIRVGGWGRIIGDPGSGYYIGQKAIMEMVKFFDGQNKQGKKLFDAIRDKFKITSDNLIQKIYRQNFSIQSIAPIVIEYAGKGEEISKKIIEESVQQLVEHVKTYSRRINHKYFKIAFAGSLIDSDNIYSKKLKASIKKKIRNVVIVEKIHGASFGAILMSSKKFNK